MASLLCYKVLGQTGSLVASRGIRKCAPLHDVAMQEEDVKLRLVSDEDDPQEISSGMMARPLQERLSAPKASYEAEALGLRIERLIDQHKTAKNRGEADMLSRLLVDVHDGGVGLADAEKIVSQMEGRLAGAAEAPPRKSANNAPAIVFALVAVVVIFVGLGGFMVASQRVINNVTTPAPIDGASKPVVGAAPIATRTWQYYPKQSLAPPEAQQSIDGDIPTNFMLFNSSGSPVQLFWIDYSGKRVFYATVGPMKTHRQQTFASHPWEVQDANGSVLLYFDSGARKDETIDLVGTMRNLKQ